MTIENHLKRFVPTTRNGIRKGSKVKFIANEVVMDTVCKDFNPDVMYFVKKVIPHSQSTKGIDEVELTNMQGEDVGFTDAKYLAPLSETLFVAQEETEEEATDESN